MERKINLEDILFESKFNNLSEADKDVIRTGTFYSFDDILKAMKEACKQTLGLASENAGLIELTSDKLNKMDYTPFITAEDDTLWAINKQGILDTIKQIEI